MKTKTMTICSIIPQEIVNDFLAFLKDQRIQIVSCKRSNYPEIQDGIHEVELAAKSEACPLNKFRQGMICGWLEAKRNG